MCAAVLSQPVTSQVQPDVRPLITPTEVEAVQRQRETQLQGKLEAVKKQLQKLEQENVVS